MKLAFSTLGCPDWGFEEVLATARHLGYDAIELRGVDGEMQADKIARFSPQRIKETQALMREHEISVCGFGSSVRFDDAAAFEQNILDGKAAIDLCARANIPFVRVFGDSIPEGTSEKTISDQIIRGIGLLCEYAAGTPVSILLEVHGVFNTKERILRICQGISHKNFGILWDIGHTDKIYFDDFAAFYTPLRPWIRHVHIKDQKRLGGQEYALCMVGEGDVPIAAIVKAMLRDGYPGYFSLEWEKKWHPELEEPQLAFERHASIMRAIGHE